MIDHNPFLIIVIGDFNARSSSCCFNDKSNLEWTQINCLATEYDLKQVMNEPTHLVENFSSCIDLIFLNQILWWMRASMHPYMQIVIVK